MIRPECLSLLSQLLVAQTRPSEDSRWVPLTQWSDIPIGLLVKYVVVPLVVVAVVWAAVQFRMRRARVSYFSPRRLFLDLCKLHDLDWPTRKLLRQLARFRHPEHPARVFVDPACFDPADLPPPLQAFRNELLQLKSRLF